MIHRLCEGSCFLGARVHDWSDDQLLSMICIMRIKQKTINATEFKAKCLEILDHLDKNGIVVSKRGKPIALVFPYAGIETKKLIGSMRGKIKIKGNILSTGVKWNAKS